MSVRFAIAYFFAIAGVSFTSWAVRIPYLQVKLNITKFEWGLLLLCPVISSFFSSLISNYLINRYLNKRVLIGGVILVSLSLEIIGWANIKPILALGLFIFGLGMGLFNIAMNDQAAMLERQYQRSIMASFHGIFSLGGMLGALLGSVFAKFTLSSGYHLTFIAGIIVIGSMISYHFLFPTTRSDALSQISLFTLPKGKLWLVGSIAIASVFIEGAMSDWAALYLKDMQATDSFSAMGLAFFAGAMALGRLLGDKYINRLGYTKSLKTAAWLTVLGLISALLAPNPLLAVFGFTITGLGMAIIFPCLLSLATHLKHKNMPISDAISAVSMMGYVALLIGPPMIGFIANIIGLHFSFLALLFSGIMILMMVYRINFA